MYFVCFVNKVKEANNLLTGDQNLIKRINKGTILNLIKDQCPISRAQISELTKLTKSTVSSIVAELIQEQLVYEIGTGPSSGGRKPLLLMFQNKSAFAIGIDIGVNYLLTILTDLNGKVLAERIKHFPYTNFEESIHLKDKIVDLMISEIDQLLNPITPSVYGLIGIGIAVPGIVGDNGKILLAPNLGWMDFSIADKLKLKYGVPIIIQNEANVGAIGEMVFGEGKNIDNFIYVSAGIGIGIGIVLRRALFNGNHGFAGEAGHMCIDFNGKRCSCGSKGCWELYASEHALLTQSSSLLEPNEELTLDTILAKTNEGHEQFINVFNNIGQYLGIGISNLINIFDPETVIIGNKLAAANEWLSNPITRTINSRVFSQRKNIKIEFSNLKEYSAATGAAYLAISSFLSTFNVEIPSLYDHVYTI
jgi:predicted NBD/HSP70 family sugar kinase